MKTVLIVFFLRFFPPFLIKKKGNKKCWRTLRKSSIRDKPDWTNRNLEKCRVQLMCELSISSLPPWQTLKFLLTVSVNLTPHSVTIPLRSLPPTPTPGGGTFNFSSYWYKQPSSPSHKRLALLIQTCTIFNKGLSGPCIQYILSDLQCRTFLLQLRKRT